MKNSVFVCELNLVQLRNILKAAKYFSTSIVISIPFLINFFLPFLLYSILTYQSDLFLSDHVLFLTSPSNSSFPKHIFKTKIFGKSEQKGKVQRSSEKMTGKLSRDRGTFNFSFVFDWWSKVMTLCGPIIESNGAKSMESKFG